jgi:hypothetical protein
MLLLTPEFGGCLRPDDDFLGNEGEGDEIEEFTALTDVCRDGGWGRLTFWRFWDGLAETAVAITRNGNP